MNYYEIIAKISTFVNTIPTKNKIPVISSWKEFQKRRITKEEYIDWFQKGLYNSQFAVLMGGINKLVCIDFDNKIEDLEKIFKESYSYLIHKKIEFYSERTPSGGFHIILKCDDAENFKSEKIAINSKEEAFIETKGEGGYVVVNPSPDYDIINKNMSFIEFLENARPVDELSILQFLEFLKNYSYKKEMKNEVIIENDNKNLFKSDKEKIESLNFLLDEFRKAGWKVLKETDNWLEIQRPGGDGITGGINKKEVFYYNFSTNAKNFDTKGYNFIKTIQALKNFSSLKEAVEYIKKNVPNFSLDKSNTQKYLKIEGVEKISDDLYEWNGIIMNKDCKIVNISSNFGNFLSKKIGKIDQNSKEIYVVDEKVIRQIDISEIRQEIKKIYVDFCDKNNITSILIGKPIPISVVIDRFVEHFLKPEKLSGLQKSLSMLDINFFTNYKNANYFYFKNCVVKVVKDKIDILSYDEIDHFVFEKNIIKKDFKLINREFENTFNFCKFVRNIAGSEEKYEILKKIIGFLLDKHKTNALNKAIIFKDYSSLLDNTSANGRTGKSLLIKAISYLRKVSILDGRTTDWKSRFIFDRVDYSTDLLFIDDVDKKFNFNFLFNRVTGDFVIEKKNQGSFVIPFEVSPKIVIASNFFIDDQKDESTKTRIQTFYLANYYNAKKTPNKEFGEYFFEDWDDEKWNVFFNFFIKCNFLYRQNQEFDFEITEDDKYLQLLNSLRSEVNNSLLIDVLKDLCKNINIFTNENYSEKHKTLTNQKISNAIKKILQKLQEENLIKYVKERDSKKRFYEIQMNNIDINFKEKIEQIFDIILLDKNDKNNNDNKENGNNEVYKEKKENKDKKLEVEDLIEDEYKDPDELSIFKINEDDNDKYLDDDDNIPF